MTTPNLILDWFSKERNIPYYQFDKYNIVLQTDYENQAEVSQHRGDLEWRAAIAFMKYYLPLWWEVHDASGGTSAPTIIIFNNILASLKLERIRKGNRPGDTYRVWFSCTRDLLSKKRGRNKLFLSSSGELVTIPPSQYTRSPTEYWADARGYGGFSSGTTFSLDTLNDDINLVKKLFKKFSIQYEYFDGQVKPGVDFMKEFSYISAAINKIIDLASLNKVSTSPNSGTSISINFDNKFNIVAVSSDVPSKRGARSPSMEIGLLPTLESAPLNIVQTRIYMARWDKIVGLAKSINKRQGQRSSFIHFLENIASTSKNVGSKYVIKYSGPSHSEPAQVADSNDIPGTVKGIDPENPAGAAQEVAQTAEQEAAARKKREDRKRKKKIFLQQLKKVEKAAKDPGEEIENLFEEIQGSEPVRIITEVINRFGLDALIREAILCILAGQSGSAPSMSLDLSSLIESAGSLFKKPKKPLPITIPKFPTEKELAGMFTITGDLQEQIEKVIIDALFEALKAIIKALVELVKQQCNIKQAAMAAQAGEYGAVDIADLLINLNLPAPEDDGLNLLDRNAGPDICFGDFNISASLGKGFLSQVSQILVPIEVCQLLLGSASRDTIDAVMNFIATRASSSIQSSLTNEAIVVSFFKCIGDIADVRELCQSIINDDILPNVGEICVPDLLAAVDDHNVRELLDMLKGIDLTPPEINLNCPENENYIPNPLAERSVPQLMSVLIESIAPSFYHAADGSKTILLKPQIGVNKTATALMDAALSSSAGFEQSVAKGEDPARTAGSIIETLVEQMQAVMTQDLTGLVSECNANLSDIFTGLPADQIGQASEIIANVFNNFNFSGMADVSNQMGNNRDAIAGGFAAATIYTFPKSFRDDFYEFIPTTIDKTYDTLLASPEGGTAGPGDRIWNFDGALTTPSFSTEETTRLYADRGQPISEADETDVTDFITQIPLPPSDNMAELIIGWDRRDAIQEEVDRYNNQELKGENVEAQCSDYAYETWLQGPAWDPEAVGGSMEGVTRILSVIDFARTFAGESIGGRGNYHIAQNEKSAFYRGDGISPYAGFAGADAFGTSADLIFPVRWYSKDYDDTSEGTAGMYSGRSEEELLAIEGMEEEKDDCPSRTATAAQRTRRRKCRDKVDERIKTYEENHPKQDRVRIADYRETARRFAEFGTDEMSYYDIYYDPYMQWLYSQTKGARVHDATTVVTTESFQNQNVGGHNRSVIVETETIHPSNMPEDVLAPGPDDRPGSSTPAAEMEDFLVNEEDRDFAPMWFREPFSALGHDSPLLMAPPNEIPPLPRGTQAQSLDEEDWPTWQEIFNGDDLAPGHRGPFGLEYGYPSHCLVEIFDGPGWDWDFGEHGGHSDYSDYIQTVFAGTGNIEGEVPFASEGYLWEYTGGAVKYALLANEEWERQHQEDDLPVHIGKFQTMEDWYSQAASNDSTTENRMKFVFRKTFNKTVNEDLLYPSYSEVTEQSAPIVRVKTPERTSDYDVSYIFDELKIGTLSPGDLEMHAGSHIDLYGLGEELIGEENSNPAQGILSNLAVTSMRKMIERNDLDKDWGPDDSAKWNIVNNKINKFSDAMKYQYHPTAMASLIKQLSKSILERGSFSTDKVLDLLMVSTNSEEASSQIGDLLDYQSIIDEVKKEFIEASCQDTDLTPEEILRNSLRFGVVLLFLQVHLVQFYLQNIFVFSAFKLTEIFTLDAVVSYISRAVTTSMNKLLHLVTVENFHPLFRKTVTKYMKRKINRRTTLDAEVLESLGLTRENLIESQNDPSMYEKSLNYLLAKRLKDSASAVQNIISRCNLDRSLENGFIHDAIGASDTLLHSRNDHPFKARSDGLVIASGELDLGLNDKESELLAYGGFRFEKVIRWSASKYTIDPNYSAGPFGESAGQDLDVVVGEIPATGLVRDAQLDLKERFYIPAGESFVNGFASAEKLQLIANRVQMIRSEAIGVETECWLYNPKLYYRLVYYPPMQSNTDEVQVVGVRKFSPEIVLGGQYDETAFDRLVEDDEIMTSGAQAKNEELIDLFGEILGSNAADSSTHLETLLNKEEAYVPMYVGPARTRENMIVGIPIGEIPSGRVLGDGEKINIFSEDGAAAINFGSNRRFLEGDTRVIRESELYDLVFRKSLDWGLVVTTLLFNNFYLTNAYFSKMGTVFTDTKNAIAELLITVTAHRDSLRPVRSQRAIHSIQDSVKNAGASNIDRPNIGMYIVKAIIETPLDILKGLAEIVDPHVAITKVIRDLTGVAIQQFVGVVQTALDSEPTIAAMGIDVEKLLNDLIFCKLNEELKSIGDLGTAAEELGDAGIDAFPTFSTKGLNFTGTIPGLFMAPPGPLGIFYLIYGLLKREHNNKLEDAMNVINSSISDSSKRQICDD